MSRGLRQLTCLNLHCAKFVVWLSLVIIGEAEPIPLGAVCLLQQAFSKGAGGELGHARTGTAFESKIRQISDRLPIASLGNMANAKTVSVSLGETAAQSITQPVDQPVSGVSLLLHAMATRAIAVPRRLVAMATEAMRWQRSPCSPPTPGPSSGSGSPSSGAPCKAAEVALLGAASSHGRRAGELQRVGIGTRLFDFSDIMTVCLFVVLVLVGFFLYRGGTWQQLQARPVESLQTGYGEFRETINDQQRGSRGTFYSPPRTPQRQQKGTDCLGVPCC